MLPEELDRLASNFLVTRRQGTQATGTQRIYFTDVQAVQVATSAVFRSEDGQVFRPVTSVNLSAAELSANRLATGEYYVDVAIVSESVGSAARAAAGAIDTVFGVVGATRTENLADLVGGDEEESNTELEARLRTNLTNRELVKKDGIASTITEAFSSVRSVVVQGFGDPYQTRDVVQASAGLRTLIPRSFCQKINLPLDANGEVSWDQTGAIPAGGFAGAIFDVTGRDLTDLQVTLDGRTQQRICVNPGDTVRFVDSEDPDSLDNDWLVVRSETVPIGPSGPERRVLRFNKALELTELIDDQIDRYPYELIGPSTPINFHVGGKVDVYVDTTDELERTVVVGSVPPATLPTGFTTGVLDVGEIPLTATAVDGLGNSIFEGNIGFASPVISITKVEQIDFVNDEEVIRTLIPGTQYNIVRQATRSRFSEIDSDILVVKGTENPIDPSTGQPSETAIPLFVGQRLRITYITNPALEAIQSFVDSSSQRDVTKDIQVRFPEFLLANVTLEYSGTAEESDVKEIVTNFINQLGFNDPLCMSDLISVLGNFGVDKVHLPARIRVERPLGNGSSEFLESENEVVPAPIELFRAVENLDITKK